MLFYDKPNNEATPYDSFIGTAANNAIENWWTGDMVVGDTLRVLSVFERMKKKGYRLRCDCQVNNGPSPIMELRTINGVSPVLTRMSSAPHEKTCPYAQAGAVHSFAGLQKAQKAVTPTFEGPCDDGANIELDLGVDEGALMPAPTLGLFLGWIAQSMGWQNYPAPSDQDAELMLDAVASSIESTKNWRHRLFTSPQALLNGNIKRTFSDAYSDGEIGAACWVVGPIKSLDTENKEVSWRGADDLGMMSYQGLVRGGDCQRDDPHLVGIAAIQMHQGHPSIMRLYVSTIATESCRMLVDSTQEKNAFSVLGKFVDAHRRHGSDVTLHKPMFDWKDTGLKPDFVVEEKSTSKLFFVELMDADDEGYVCLKKAKIRELEKIAPVCVFANTETGADAEMLEKLDALIAA